MDCLASRPPLLNTGIICLLSATVVLLPLFKSLSTRPSRVTLSPKDTLLSLSQSEISSLPYPPDALPGGRDVLTPYGTFRVFELGAASGERVLILPGLSTPCLSLSDLAEALVQKGYRVMLFDYFGRGWSDTPNPDEVDYDQRLYASQILMALASSHVSWLGNAERGNKGGFHVIGYSFGGGLAVNFASWFPHLIRSVTAITPGGLLSRSSNSWQTRLIYSRGIFPESLLQRFVRRRFEPAYTPYTTAEDSFGGVGVLAEQAEMGQMSKITGDPFDDAVLSARRPDVTVASVMSWQLRHHKGFVPAVMSTTRYGPIYERYEEWRRLGLLLSGRREDPSLPGLLGGKILLVLATTDPIIKVEEILPEVKDTLGEDAFEVKVLDCGHEVAIVRGAEIADIVSGFWGRC
ncbi:hypothetical protein VP1G_03534 [Cytospora mali]|uniref:AB hydrolase-1 domain-containing protein n=1 Tax=Cytospora mali TaxID=578113 RepID=A0A194UWY4_CYTMA|nr:hypothetical protein VP1G_03534 [Valsa mali var. pyri (nom. inval.)]